MKFLFFLYFNPQNFGVIHIDFICISDDEKLIWLTETLYFNIIFFLFYFIPSTEKKNQNIPVN